MHAKRTSHFFLSALSLTLLPAVASAQEQTVAPAPQTYATADNATNFRVETVATGLEIPWAMAFTPDGRLFVTERPGRLRVIANGVLQEKPVAEFPEVQNARETGLMGLALHPRFAQNRWLYVAYAYQGKERFVRVERFRETADGLTERKTIIEDIPAANYHAGCRIKFGPDGKLYITTGDATAGSYAQRLDSLHGKTLRVNDDGSIPGDNPFARVAGARAEIFSYGHRNSQGLDWQPWTGRQFQTEHGPTSILDGIDFIYANGGGDEVNIVEAGRNYGWPVIHHERRRSFMETPLLEYTPAVAPGGATFYRGTTFPQWSGNFFFANLKDKSLVRLVLNGSRVVSQETLIKGEFGRLRDVAEGPDGALYICTSNRDPYGKPSPEDDRILRIVPVK
ncbi:MAG TPA: PQQ-dependent sugar dehydrogenase [Abditibacteriaceae bacterium]|jgi:glucose/arabinose dehydrogenase